MYKTKLIIFPLNMLPHFGKKHFYPSNCSDKNLEGSVSLLFYSWPKSANHVGFVFKTCPRYDLTTLLPPPWALIIFSLRYCKSHPTGFLVSVLAHPQVYSKEPFRNLSQIRVSRVCWTVASMLPCIVKEMLQVWLRILRQRDPLGGSDVTTMIFIKGC